MCERLRRPENPAALKGRMRIGLEFLLYDFSEEATISSNSQKNQVRRPQKPMKFQLTAHHKDKALMEVWYKGSLPVLVCSCSDNNPDGRCSHKNKLTEVFFARLMDDLFDRYDSNYDETFLSEEVARQIAKIHPRSEKSAFEEPFGDEDSLEEVERKIIQLQQSIDDSDFEALFAA